MAIWMAALGALMKRPGESGSGGGGARISNPVQAQINVPQAGHQMVANRFRLSDENQKVRINSGRARLREAMRYIAETEGEDAVDSYAIVVNEKGEQSIVPREDAPTDGYQTDGVVDDETFGRVRLSNGSAEFDDERQDRVVQAARKLERQPPPRDVARDLDPLSYEYRDSAPQDLATADPGQRTVGNTTSQYKQAGLGGLVRQTPDGEVVDTGGLAQAGLAAAATNRQDLDEVQRQVGALRRAVG